MEPSSRSILFRYSFAAAMTIAAVLLRYALTPLIGGGTTFLLSFPAAMLAAWYGGLWPGLLSTAISIVGAAVLLTPAGGVAPHLTGVAPIATRFGIFLASGVLISVLCERLHRAQRHTLAHAAEHARTQEHLQSSKRELEAARERLESILASVSDAYYTLDREWRFTHLNPQAERHFGRSRNELIGEVVWEVVPAGRGTEFERRYRLAMETGTAQHIEALSPLTQRWVEVHVYPFDGGLSIFFRDVSARKEIEQALRERENEFRTIFELAAAGKAQAEAGTARITRVNRRLCEITGYGESELLGKTFMDITHPDDLTRDVEIVAPVYRGERDGWETEKRYLRKDGSVAWVHVTGRLLRDGEGRPLRTIATIVDVSERKRAEQALRQREDQLRLITNAVPALISYVDAECRYQMINETYERWFGHSAAEMKGMAVREVLGEAAWKMVEPHMRRALAGEHVTYEQELPYVGVGKRWVHVDYAPDRDEAGRVRGFAVLVHDITEAKRSEQALRESEARFRNLADNAPVMIWITDPDGQCTYVNKQWLEFTGQTAEQGRGLGWLEAVHPDDRGWAEELFLRANEARENFRIEFRLRRRDGEYRWCIDSASPRTDAAGGYLGYVGSVLDITERKRIEEDLRDATEVAEQANRAKDQFLAVLSHELRTPLTPVLTASQMLESEGEGRSAAELRELASVIRRNVELEARLIDDLLDLTRVSRGKLLLTIEAVDAHERVREVLRAVGTEAEAREVRVRLELGAPRHHVRGDHARFQQVIANLLRNAIKFSHAGGEVTVRTRNDVDGLLTLEVIDRGVGIEGHVLPRLFTAFEQGGRDTTRQFGGLGLGLAISKALVDAQGGTITARSEGKDRGATFTVTMPLAEPAGTAGDGDGNGRRGTPRGHRVLLVEDHEDTSRLMAMLLRGSGYSVKTAGTVADALRTAEAEPFDVVVSDLGLPDGTGNDLMQQLLAKHNLRGVAVSGYGMEEDVRRAKQAGFVEHLTKPVNANQMLDVLDRVLAG